MRLVKGKKGLELTLGTMVVSILVLVVLVVLILIFTGVMSKTFLPGVKDCLQKGGECKAPTECGSGTEYARTVGDCTTAGNVCCIRVPGTQ